LPTAGAVLLPNALLSTLLCCCALELSISPFLLSAPLLTAVCLLHLLLLLCAWLLSLLRLGVIPLLP
jgi:hypothetical protein